MFWFLKITNKIIIQNITKNDGFIYINFILEITETSRGEPSPDDDRDFYV